MGYIATKLIESAFIYTSKFLGFIHPLNVSASPGENLTLFLGVKNAKAWLSLSLDETEDQKASVIILDFIYIIDMKVSVCFLRHRERNHLKCSL